MKSNCLLIVKYFLVLITACIFYTKGLGQFVISKDSIAKTPVKSNLSYEALTQFFQASVAVGRNGGFDFKSSLFGIQKLFSKKDLDLSDYYLKRKSARNTEFSFGVHKDDKDNVNVLVAGFKYALINNRSKSDVNFLQIPEIAMQVQNMGSALYKAEEIYHHSIAKGNAAAELRFINALKKYTKSQNLKDLPDGMQSILDSIVTNSYRSDTSHFFHVAQRSYDIAAKRIDQKGLLTLAINPGYSWSNRRFDSIAIAFQFVKGFGNIGRPWNLDAQINNHFLYDTVSKKANLSRSITSVSLGLNKILMNDDGLNPVIEFEMALENDYVYSRLYSGEKRNKISLNAILRIHIAREIVVPLSLAFDLMHPNVAGFLKVNWNLENSKKK